MIKVKEYKATIDAYKTAIPGINHIVYVTQENQAINRVKDRRGVTLVVVLPSTDTSGKLGRQVDDTSCLFFIVEKCPPSLTEAQEFDLYERTQDITNALRHAIVDSAESGCSIFYRLSPDSIHIDPEYNIFGGFAGWSMVLVF
jgi:hypothetical protein